MHAIRNCLDSFSETNLDLLKDHSNKKDYSGAVQREMKILHVDRQQCE